MVELTALQKLAAFLDPSPSVATVDEQNAARTGKRGEDREAFLRAAEKPEAERNKIINELATRYYSEAGFTAQEIGNAVNEFARNTPSEFEPPEQPENPQQFDQQGGILAGLAKGLGERRGTAPSAGGGRAKDMATDAVHNLQEQQLLKEFDDALEQGNETRMAELMGSLDANKLLQEQTQHAHDHLDLLTSAERELSRLDGMATDKNGKPILGKDGKPLTKIQLMHNEFDRQALKQAEARKKADEKELTPAQRDAREKQRKHEAELEAIAKDTSKNTEDGKRQRKAAFHGLVQERLSQTRPYSVFLEYYDQDLDGLLVPLSQLIANQEQVRLRKKQGLQNVSNQQANNATDAVNAVQRARGGLFNRLFRQNNVLKGAGGKNKLAKEVLGKGVEAAAAAAGVEEAVWVLKHWKLLVAIVVIYIVVYVSIIIAILTLLFPQSQTEQPTLQPTCTPESACEQQLRSIGVSVRGDLSLNGDPYGKAKLVYDTLSLITQSPSQFATLLKIPTKPITLYFSGSACAGHASANGLVILSGFGACGTNVARFMLIHELSHEIAFRNPGLYNSFLNQFPRSSLTLPTYNCQFDYGKGPYPAECFADTLGEYPVYKTYRNIVGGRPSYFEHVFSSFITSFSPFYNFAKKNVYGGLEF